MPRGGYRPGAGRPKGSSKVTHTDAVARVDVPAQLQAVQEASPEDEKTPLEYMLAVINDPTADQNRRDRMAIAAAPFMHPKTGESGKKDRVKEAARVVGSGRFAPASPPKLVVNNS